MKFFLPHACIFILFQLLLLLPFSAAFASQNFDSWLEGVRQDARRQGISQSTLDAAFLDVQPIEKVISLDRKQPEGRLSFAQYRERVINNARIQQGQRLYAQHRNMLDDIARQYGVPAPYIVALWGIETSYGNNTGGFSVISALATLGFEGRRGEFFRGELMQALKIVDAGHIQASDMRGSWAGAMGQNQFMPSSFQNFAVDHNRDGRRDIWNSLPDVFASTANYLSKSGWKEDERWGRAVKLPAGFSEAYLGLDNRLPLEQWQKLGVQLPSGGPIPLVEGMQASVIAPDGLSGPAFLVYDNFRTIMKWNKSTYFATSVGLLADSIAQ